MGFKKVFKNLSGLEDAEVTTEKVKCLVKAGVLIIISSIYLYIIYKFSVCFLKTMTINKHEEKQTFKRSKQLDRKLKVLALVLSTI